ncbi:MAG: MoaD/ThiS family protein [Desulfobacterales bacterium]|jgi:molybdopterin synthase sulfur carrier subunit|nr:MoaD/ThiS family protein [Desulfobacterales bacterium]
MQKYISIRLFATLNRYTPDTADSYPVRPGTTVRDLIDQLGVPLTEVKLIFIDGVKGDIASALNGGERVGIFPPVGGG